MTWDDYFTWSIVAKLCLLMILFFICVGVWKA